MLLMPPALMNRAAALEPIVDANSYARIIREVSSLPEGGIFNLTFKSKIDSSFQPLLIKVPKEYTKETKWPLLVVLHGLGDGPIIVPQIDSMVQFGPFGRGDLWYRGKGQQDVFECIELAKKIFNIDDERIYLCGFSMGAAGVFELGLKYPHLWAACVPVCGWLSDMNLVENGRNLPFWINAGSEDKLVPAKDSRKSYDEAVRQGINRWRYTEHQGMGHSFRIDWDKIEKWLLSQKKIKSPEHVTFSCHSLGRAYWIEITKKHKEYKVAKIEAKVEGQKTEVRTSNVADYILYLKDAPLDSSRRISIIENSREVFAGKVPEEGFFVRKSVNKSY